MAEGHPRWFRTSLFGKKVLNFSLRRAGWLHVEDAIYIDEEVGTEESLAVRIIGDAVYTLQMIIRRRLRPLFIESISLIAGQVEGHLIEIFRFMQQSYLGSDIFLTILTSLAIIAELVIFMHDFGIPLMPGSYHMPWCHIYSQRLRNELDREGGFEKLLEVAQNRYIFSGIYDETRRSQVFNEPIPHAEEQILENWPENPQEFLAARFPVAPQNFTLAMDILRKIHFLQPGFVPPAEDLWL